MSPVDAAAALKGRLRVLYPEPNWGEGAPLDYVVIIQKENTVDIHLQEVSRGEGSKGIKIVTLVRLSVEFTEYGTAFQPEFGGLASELLPPPSQEVIDGIVMDVEKFFSRS